MSWLVQFILLVNGSAATESLSFFEDEIGPFRTVLLLNGPFHEGNL
jgi:hypothetical protein